MTQDTAHVPLDERGLEAAREQPGTNHDGIIRAYLQTAAADVSGLVERLANRARTKNGAGEGPNDVGYYEVFAAADDRESASTIQTLSTRNAALEAENERLRRESEWQPIETAPKDGTWVKLWRGASEFGRWDSVVTARWHEFEDGEEFWVWPDEPFDPYTEAGRNDADELIANGDYFQSVEFSHWQALSAPKGGQDA